MRQRLRVLYLEDDPVDADLVRRLLASEGFDCEVTRVDTWQAFLAGVAEAPLDLVLSDHALSSFDGMAALRLVRERKPELPFIFLSATAGEEVAIDAMKAGATDYVLKERMARLAPSVRRALRESEEHRQRLRAEEALVEAERRAGELARVARRLTEDLDVDAVAQRIVESVLTVFKPQAALLRLMEADGTLRCAALAGSPLDDFQRGYRTRPGVGMVGRAVTERRAVWTPDVLSEHGLAFSDEFRRSLAKAQNHAVLAVPLLVKDEVIGVLSFVESRVRSFSEEEVSLLQTFADQAALAIRNVQLFAHEQAARAEAESASRGKDRFLAMLAHELRNPLAPIAAAAHILVTRESSDPLLTQAGRIVRRQVGQLTRLLDDLLDVSRITRGIVELKKATVDVRDTIADAVAVVRNDLDERRHELHVCLPDRPLLVQADGARLVQVVTNLLQNATKYTPQGGRIEIAAEARDRMVVLRVTDTGLGIAPEFLPNVFDMFTQADRSLARTEGGLGIGLTIVRSIVELHGGSVTAHSDGLGGGSRFTVSLPVGNPEVVGEGEAIRDSRIIASRHVLVVEDNQDSREMLCAALELHGHRVDRACDGAEGVRLGLTQRPEIALVDIGLPGLDGYEVCRQIRAALGSSIRLIAVTGYGQPAERRRAEEVGFDAHLTKPVDTGELLRTIDLR